MRSYGPGHPELCNAISDYIVVQICALERERESVRKKKQHDGKPGGRQGMLMAQPQNHKANNMLFSSGLTTHMSAVWSLIFCPPTFTTTQVLA